MTERMQWQIIDRAMGRLAALFAVASVAMALVMGLRGAKNQLFDALVAFGMTIVFLALWFMCHKLTKVRVFVNEGGIGRTGGRLGNFTAPWDTVRQAAIGSGLLGGQAPYLIADVTGRNRGISDFSAAGSPFKGANTSLPVEAALVDQLRGVLEARGVFRDEQTWVEPGRR
ncbi:hypothetical protein ACQCX5_10625 [Propionibacteriaceae bacterium G57]|uniref:hypothetical protein n=1 Tax=Aestuariimicrobium sp. G57 TaxID=3418485 RepID=UPI003DA75445